MAYIRAEIGVVEQEAREWFADLIDGDGRYVDIFDFIGTRPGLDVFSHLRELADSRRSDEDSGGGHHLNMLLGGWRGLESDFAATNRPGTAAVEPSSSTSFRDGEQAAVDQTSASTAAALPVYTNAQIADQLVNGYWNSQGLDWHAWNVGSDGAITVNLTGLTADGKNLARMALAAWSDIIGVNFVEVTSGGEIIFDDSDPSGAYADTGWLGNTMTDAFVNIPTSWLFPGPDGYTSLNDYAYQTYLHEIGHALGLGHAGNYNGNATYPNDALYANDAWSTTVMSYFSQTENSYFADQGFTYSYAVTPMVGDILAMQTLYGLSTDTRSGNTVYGTGSTADNPVYDATAYPDVAVTVFDTGGIDTLNYSGFSTNQTINLNPEVFSSVGLGVGNLMIAPGVVIENAVGGSGNDILTGNSVANVLEGGNGNDTINGGGGTDTLIGGGGADTLTGGAGGDTFKFEAGDGMDTVTDLESADSVEIRGFNSAQSITQSGTDVIVVLSSSDRITFQNTTVAEVQAVLQFPDNTSVIDGTTGDDVLNGGDGDDTINGLAGNDTLNGWNGNDTLNGGAGNDRLNGGAGDDVLQGGAGNDTYYVDSAGDTAVENAGEGNDLVSSSISWTLGANFEWLTLTGAAAIDGTGNELANIIFGNGAANILSGLAGNDTLDGRAGNDTLNGGDGNDHLVGGPGDDTLSGGAGNDSYSVGSLGDTIVENADEGNDLVLSSISWTLGANLERLQLVGTANLDGTGNGLDNLIIGNSGANVLTGLAGNDRLNGGSGNDTLNGGDGNDWLIGGAGDDLLQGGAGLDTYYVDSAGDTIVENAGEGNDLVSSSISWTLGANLEWLVLTGAAAINGTGNELANIIFGNGAANVLSGLAGNDTLDGKAGNDWLEGGASRDILIGGTGADNFVFRDGDFAGLTAASSDKINDFSQAQGDKIHLAFVDANTLVDGDQAFDFIGSAAFSNTAGELRYEQLNGNTYVYGDTDGDGVADFMILLTGSHALVEGDFVI